MMMNKEQVELSVKAGLELLGPESDISIPAKLNDGIFLLKQLLALIAQGQMGLQPVVQQPPSGDAPPKQPGTPDEDKRAANRKKRPKKK